jgi:hypothetical protein
MTAYKGHRYDRDPLTGEYIIFEVTRTQNITQLRCVSAGTRITTTREARGFINSRLEEYNKIRPPMTITLTR